MNPAPLVFLATFFAIAMSWLSFVLVPQIQIGQLPQKPTDDTSQMYPGRPAGMAKQGEAVYRANGCFYCHTEQVRPKGFGADVERNWGARLGPVQSVAQDYLFAQPAMLGSQRVGPDLTNIGLRQTNDVWFLEHFYDPQLFNPKSSMPPYRFLFEKRKLRAGQRPSPDALPTDPKRPEYELLPTADCKALVAYLRSLHSDGILFEAPTHPITKKKAGDSGTNAPGTNAAPAAATTNSPAK